MGENTKGQKYHYIQYITISNIYCRVFVINGILYTSILEKGRCRCSNLKKPTACFPEKQ